ncbi:MAG TPA: DUF3106 domain-containing protein [Telluria sp.]|nr:DUF3106 domain-containing protein [Telluria sp.]
MRIWRSAVNKVTGNRLLFILKAAAATVAAVLAVSVSAQAPVAAPPAKPAVKPVQKPLDKPLWATLSRAQQVALEPLAGEWDRMEAMRKQKWLEIANRFASMKPDEQARMHERMREWVKLTPDQRRLARENYTLSKKIDASRKSEQWEKYQQLPEEQKKQLAAEAAKARAKKQVTNLPPQGQSNVRTVAPIKRSVPTAACAAGTVKNTAAATPPCVPAPGAAAPVPPTPAAAPAPVPNAK